MPVFTTGGSLYLGDADGGAPGGEASFLSDFQSVSDVDTQIQLLQSRTLIERAILETGLNASIVPEGRKPMPYWKWRFQYGQSVAVFAPAAGDLKAEFASIDDPASRGASFIVSFDDATHYRLLVTGGWFNGARTVLTGILNQPASGAGLHLLIKSAVEGVAPAAGARYQLAITPADAMAGALIGGALTVSAGGAGSAQTKLANIQFGWGDPFLGQIFVNQLMADFIAMQLSWKTESASTTEDFITNQLENIKASLTNADRNLAAYQSQTGIVDVPVNAQAVISQLSQYEVQRTAILLQQESLLQLSADMARHGGTLNPYLVSQANDPVLAQLAGSLAQAQVALNTQSVQFTDNAPEVQAQQATVLKTEDAIRTLVANDARLATENLANINKLIGQYEEKLQAMPAQSLKVIALTRSSDVLGQIYVLLMQKEEEAEVSKAATIVGTKVVTPAELPLQPTKPKAKMTVLAGLLFGLLAGLSVVLAQRALSGRFQSDDDVRRAVQSPIYAMIPRKSGTKTSTDVLSARQTSPFSESFRLLRTNLYQSASGQNSRVILITSASIEDGKTTIASHLATFLAKDGKRVVLVDGDLHRGRAHEALKIAQSPGLAEWLVTKTPSQLQAVSNERFLVLASGMFPPNPSELLNEELLTEIMTTLRSKFDFIIIDCPPLPAVTDTLILGKHADLILSVVRIEHTQRRIFQMHQDIIRTLDCRHGVIINGVVLRGYHDGYEYSYGIGMPPCGVIKRLRKMMQNSVLKGGQWIFRRYLPFFKKIP